MDFNLTQPITLIRLIYLSIPRHLIDSSWDLLEVVTTEPPATTTPPEAEPEVEVMTQALTQTYTWVVPVVVGIGVLLLLLLGAYLLYKWLGRTPTQQCEYRSNFCVTFIYLLQCQKAKQAFWKYHFWTIFKL